LDSVTTCPDCDGTGTEGAPYRQITPNSEGYRLRVTDGQIHNELVKQGAVECRRTRFYAQPGMYEITIPTPEGVHRHTVHCDHLIGKCEDHAGSAHRFVECDNPKCVEVLWHDCVDEPRSLAVPSPWGASNGTKLRERRNMGCYQWSLNAANRPYGPDELAKIREAEAIDLDKFLRASEQLHNLIGRS
jgi:hypothetical protein